MLYVPDLLEACSRTELVPLDYSECTYFSYATVKRFLDFSVGLAILFLAAPLMMLVAILIKLDSAGPVFYRQIRCTQAGKEFWIYKFRSMPDNVEKGRGPVWGAWDDPRSTRLGRFLRITGIDELPQLFNVLKGEMSLVGPRPERPHFVEMFKKSIKYYEARHAAKAGITGWAQVNGFRGNTSVVKRVQYDIYYVEHQCFWFDLFIFLKTPLSMVLKSKSAHQESSPAAESGLLKHRITFVNNSSEPESASRVPHGDDAAVSS